MDTEGREAQRLAAALDAAQAVIIAPSNGFDIVDGYNQFACDQEFLRVFGDFHRAFGLNGILQGLMSRWPDAGARWAFLARLVDYGTRSYVPSPAMRAVDALTAGLPRFVVTCNCNSRFERAGFDAAIVLETEGTFARAWCPAGCEAGEADALPIVERLIQAEPALAAPQPGCAVDADASGAPSIPQVPDDLLPRCPHCGAVLDAAVGNAARMEASPRFQAQRAHFEAFVQQHAGARVAVLELGMGQGNPAIKQPLMALAERCPQWTYAVLNREPAVLPRIARERTFALQGDLAGTLETLRKAVRK